MRNIDNAEKFVFEHLYEPRTKLIYDYVTDRTSDGAVKHLPTPEEIANVIPNPCGWGVGMEDSVLNAGSMIEAILARYPLEPREELRMRLSDLFDGMYLCATVSSEKGYLARSVHPEDGKSYYPNSSRDQYTHWIFAACRLFDSALATEKMKAQIVDVLLSFAQKAERDVTPENNYSLLRSDGYPAFCCEMYGPLEPHEVMRLPMIYIGAYHVTGDRHWLQLYHRYRDWALEESEKITFKFPWAYCLLQMQYSLRLVWEHEEQQPYRARLAALLHKVAQGAMMYTEKTFSVFLGDTEPRYEGNTLPSWRDIPFSYYFKKPLYGRAFLVSSPYEHNPLRQVLRNGAEGIIMQLLCPDRAIPKEEADKFLALTEKLDFENASNYWPVLWIDAYYMLMGATH